MEKQGRWFALVGMAAVLVLGLTWAWTPANFSDPACRYRQNAAWISVDWTSQPADETAVWKLAESVKARRLRYLYPYVTYLQADGSFSPSYAYAQDFIAAYQRVDPDTQILAWVGLPLVNDRSLGGIRGWVDLADPDVRRKITGWVGDLVSTTGLDGVHLNAETVANNNPDFLLLLEEVRQAIGEEKLISVAGSHWVPNALNSMPGLKDLRWTSGYYQAVGRRTDQIVTMTYDSRMVHPILYRWWMREQVNGISRSLANEGTELLIGISVSQADTTTHHPEVENLANGLAGVCAGQTRPGAVDGIAIYADWEFSPDDGRIWQEWQQ